VRRNQAGAIEYPRQGAWRCRREVKDDAYRGRKIGWESADHLPERIHPTRRRADDERVARSVRGVSRVLVQLHSEQRTRSRRSERIGRMCFVEF
jgi:hypothetical protein